MTYTSTTKDYRASHFEYKILDKIHGTPDIDSILRLYKQVKRNLQRVPTKLGGGQLGYLALGIDTATFDALPNSNPFVRPVHPGDFVVTIPRDLRGTGAVLSSQESMQQKARHDELIRQYDECQAVEQITRSMITEAIDDEFLDELRNPDTDMIHESIPEIIKYLQTNFGKISEHELNDKEDTLKGMVYDPTSPVQTVFNKIKSFQDLCTLLQKPKTDGQLVTLGYLIFSKTRLFMDALKTWNEKADSDRTFTKFKTHMRNEHLALRQVGALTMKDSELSQANMLQLLTDNQNKLAHEMQTQLANTMQDNMQHAFHALGMRVDNEENVPPLHNNNSANSVTNDKLMALLQDLQAKVDTLSNENKLLKNNSNQPRTGATLDENTHHPVTGKPFKRYCWTHGCTTHWGKACVHKKRGHKDNATFKDRLGGSDLNCYPTRN